MAVFISGIVPYSLSCGLIIGHKNDIGQSITIYTWEHGHPHKPKSTTAFVSLITLTDMLF